MVLETALTLAECLDRLRQQTGSWPASLRPFNFRPKYVWSRVNGDAIRLSTRPWQRFGLRFEGRLTAQGRGTRAEGRFRLYGQQAILVGCLALGLGLIGVVAALAIVEPVGPDGQPVWSMLGALALAALVLGFGLLCMAANEWVAEAEEDYLRSFILGAFEARELDGDMVP